MRKVIWILPSAIIFLTPWLHRIAFENIMLAGIGFDASEAHAGAWILSGVSVLVTFFTAMLLTW